MSTDEVKVLEKVAQ